jgi:hypothetical protein
MDICAPDVETHQWNPEDQKAGRDTASLDGMAQLIGRLSEIFQQLTVCIRTRHSSTLTDRALLRPCQNYQLTWHSHFC